MTATVTVRVPSPVQSVLPRNPGNFRPGYAALCTGSGKSGSLVAATDGRALACVPVAADGATVGRVNLPADALKALKRSKRDPAPSITISGGYAKVKDAAYAVPGEGFPPCAEVLPNPAQVQRGIVIGFNVELLAALAESLGAKSGMVTLVVDPDNAKPAVMLPHGSDAVGIIMPCSVEGGGKDAQQGARDDAAERLESARAILAAALAK